MTPISLLAEQHADTTRKTISPAPTTAYATKALVRAASVSTLSPIRSDYRWRSRLPSYGRSQPNSGHDDPRLDRDTNTHEIALNSPSQTTDSQPPILGSTSSGCDEDTDKQTQSLRRLVPREKTQESTTMLRRAHLRKGQLRRGHLRR